MQAPVARGTKGAGSRGEARELAGRLRDVLARGAALRDAAHTPVVPTGWPGVDAALAARALDPRSAGGLSRGAVHEWLGVGDRGWSPPLSLLTHLTWQALTSCDESSRVLWIGRRVWPYPHTLVRERGVRATAVAPRALPGVLHAEELELARLPQPDDAGLLLSRSLFVDAARNHPWAIEAALRCASVAAVVADGSGLDMKATRRLQLAAEVGGSFGLLARPAREERELSAAATRWRVRRSARQDAVALSDPRPRWTIELLRCKSVRGGMWTWRG